LFCASVAKKSQKKQRKICPARLRAVLDGLVMWAINPTC